jgi:putative MATE family efflux protein
LRQVLSSVLKKGAPALAFARPYLFIRALAFLPSLTSLVGFSAFRGVLDTVTPVKISLLANLINCILDPILIFTFRMGVPGAALATLVAELLSGLAYLALLKRRKLVTGSIRALVRRPPILSRLQPLLRGGAALQLRNVALNLTFLAVARVVQSIDESGVSAAAHALSIQTFQVGGIVLLALSTVAQTVVPNDLYKSPREAKATVSRLMGWGAVLGVLFGALQLALVPAIQRSSPLPAVREAARIPAILASVFQVMNGLVFIGEGVMIGTGNFLQLSINTVAATAGCLWALGRFPPRYGLTGVWFGFGVFNSLRLLGVAVHQFYNGPLAPRQIGKDPDPSASTPSNESSSA